RAAARWRRRAARRERDHALGRARRPRAPGRESDTRAGRPFREDRHRGRGERGHRSDGVLLVVVVPDVPRLVTANRGGRGRGTPVLCTTSLRMPEAPEIDTHKMREQIAEEADRGGTLLRRIALTTALLAVFATLAALKAGATINTALMLRTEGTRLQAEASDQWSFYQAKGLQAAVEEAARAAWLAAGKEPPSEDSGQREHHLAERKEIEAKAREKEQERDDKLVESDHLLHAHHGFANAVAIFQVSIALGAVAALTRSRVVWLGSLLLGVGGVVLLGVTLSV